MISKMRGANRNFSSRMWVVAEPWERLLLLAPSLLYAFGAVCEKRLCRPLGLLRVEAHKILSAAASFRLSEAGLGRGARMCVRVICTCVRIVSGRPLRAVARSCWRRAPLDDRTQSMQTMVRIVLLFPSVLSVSFFGDSNTFGFFVAILAFLEFLTFSRRFSSLKKRFKNHEGKTPSPANHEME